MRWDLLLADVAAQMEAADRAGADREAADLARAERAVQDLAGRLDAAAGTVVGCDLEDGQRLRGRLSGIGGDVLLLVDGDGVPGTVVLVSPDAVVRWDGLGRTWNGAPARGTGPKLALVLRRLAVARAAVRVRVRGGRDLVGTIDHVGSDHLDLAEHPADEPRRPRSVHHRAVVPLRAVVTVRPLRPAPGPW